MLDEKDIELLRNIIKDTVDKTITDMLSKPLPSVETKVSIESEQPKKRGRPPKVKKVVKKKKVAKKTIDKLEDEDIIEQSAPPNRVRVASKNPRRAHGNPKGAQARIEPMDNRPRPNLFLKSDVAKQFKSDSSVDKKLWGKNEPSVRRRIADLVEVSCSICGDFYEIPSSLVLMDPETRKVSFTCDGCIRGK